MTTRKGLSCPLPVICSNFAIIMRSSPSTLAALCLGSGLANAGSTLFSGGTIVAFDEESESLDIIRDGSILVTDDRIVAVSSEPEPKNLPSDTKTIDVTGQIITPGFIDTHRHTWQTAFKSIASNTTLAEYFNRYGEFAAAQRLDADDIYLGQLTGLYESLSGGVTTILDHAHHIWSRDTARAGLDASIDSRARVFWAYAFSNTTEYTITEKIPHFRSIAEEAPYKDSPTELGIAFDSWSETGYAPENEKIAELLHEYNVSVLTTHSLGGPWAYVNGPFDLQRYGVLNTSVPVVISHASFISDEEIELLREANQYISITPESEMHYGHTNPNTHRILDQASLGVDTHFTYSADILTQARIWLQTVRYRFYEAVLDNGHIPSKNPMSADQAFTLATRAGGLALRRPDIGVIRKGAKADLVVWDAKSSDSMLGWVDPVAAVMLHANAGDVLHVLVDGEFVKRYGKLTAPEYADVRQRFLKSAKKVQELWAELPYPVLEGEFVTGSEYEAPQIADTLRGEGTGYGDVHVE